MDSIEDDNASQVSFQIQGASTPAPGTAAS